MQNETSTVEIINLLNTLESQIKENIIKYNYYVDVITDRFPTLENSKEFQKIEIQEVKDEEKNRRI